jgi:hypothetical protein
MKKNHFVSGQEQREALKKSIDGFGKQELSILDAIEGGYVPTGSHVPYAESTFVRIIVWPPS